MIIFNLVLFISFAVMRYRISTYMHVCACAGEERSVEGAERCRRLCWPIRRQQGRGGMHGASLKRYIMGK